MKVLDRLFDAAFVRRPGDSYANCVSTNPAKSTIDVTLAREQHRTYVSILKESGIDVIALYPLETYPDSVFMQDPAILGRRQSIMGRFGEASRRGEANTLAGELEEHKQKIGSINQVKEPGTLEGGDVVVTDSELFVGESKRTNANGIRQMKEALRWQKVTAVRTDLMHLLCGCSYLSNRKMIIAPDLVSPESFPGFKFIEIPESESYAADALYVGERRVLIPSGCPVTFAKLKEAEYRPIEVEISEFQKGDGGVTCLSSAVYNQL